MDITPEIEGVLRALRGSGLPSYADLAAAAFSFTGASDNAVPLASGLSAQARQRLHSKLAQLGARLVALDDRLCKQLRRGDIPALGYHLLACTILQGAGRIARATGCAGRQAQALLSAAVVFLGSGRLLLEQRTAAPAPGDDDTKAANHACLQLWAADALLGMVAARQDFAVQATAAAVFSPAAVVPWLAAAARILERAAEADGVGHLHGVAALADVCSRLLLPRPGSPFGALQAAVEADAGLAAALVRLLLGPCLRSAVALVLPAAAAAAAPGWRPPADAEPRTAPYWRQLHRSVLPLWVAPLCDEAARQLPMWRAAVHRLAAALLEGLPLHRLPAGVCENDRDDAWLSSMYLLRMAVYLPPTADGGQQQAAAWEVVRLLPRLAAGAAAMLRSPELPAGDKQAVCSIVQLLVQHTHEARRLRSAAQAAQLLAAADVALGLLPLCLEQWRERGAGGSAPADGCDVQLAQQCMQLWMHACGALEHSPYAPGTGGPGASPEAAGASHAAAPTSAALPGTPAEHAAAAAAARRLQLSCMRAVHWATAHAPPEWLQLVSPDRSSLAQLELLEQACRAAEAAGYVSRAAERLVPDDAAVEAAFRLRECASHAAQWEAMQLVFAALSPAELASIERSQLGFWTSQLAAAAAAAPPAVVTDASLAVMLRMARAAYQGRRDGEAAVEAREQLGMLAARPHAWWAALASGVAAELVEAIAALSSSKEQLQGGEAGACAEVLQFFEALHAALDALRQQALDLASELELRPAPDAIGGGGGGADAATAQQLQQLAAQLAEGLREPRRLMGSASPMPAAAAAALQEQALRSAEAAARLLRQHQQRQHEQEQRLELARAAATRACAYLRCANLGQGGGAAAGEGEGSSKCSQCRTAWYCSTACSHADWRESGHRRVCRALAAERQQRRAAGGGRGGGGGGAG